MHKYHSSQVCGTQTCPMANDSLNFNINILFLIYKTNHVFSIYNETKRKKLAYGNKIQLKR